MPLLDPHKRDLTAWEAEPVTIGYGDDVLGRGTLGNRIARLIARALRDAKEDGRGRPEVGTPTGARRRRRTAGASARNCASRPRTGP